MTAQYALSAVEALKVAISHGVFIDWNDGADHLNISSIGEPPIYVIENLRRYRPELMEIFRERGHA